jgi:hypothetical protein
LTLKVGYKIRIDKGGKASFLTLLLATAPSLLVIDFEDLSFEAVAGPSATAGPAAGIEAISMVSGMGKRGVAATSG